MSILAKNCYYNNPTQIRSFLSHSFMNCHMQVHIVDWKIIYINTDLKSLCKHSTFILSAKEKSAVREDLYAWVQQMDVCTGFIYCTVTYKYIQPTNTILQNIWLHAPQYTSIVCCEVQKSVHCDFLLGRFQLWMVHVVLTFLTGVFMYHFALFILSIDYFFLLWEQNFDQAKFSSWHVPVIGGPKYGQFVRACIIVGIQWSKFCSTDSTDMCNFASS